MHRRGTYGAPVFAEAPAPTDEALQTRTPDAWISEDATNLGCEVGVTRHFCNPQPLHGLQQIGADTPAPRGRLEAALPALERLDAVTGLLPNAALLLCSFVRKEAVLSSMIEGTQPPLADLMSLEGEEQPGVPMEDAREAIRCVAALEHGLARVRRGLPLSLRLIRALHQV